MPRIDLIGAVGVGKSTLLRMLAAQPSPRRWLTRNEAEVQVIMRLLGRRKTLSSRLKLAAMSIPALRRRVVGQFHGRWYRGAPWNNPASWGPLLVESQQFTSVDPTEAMRIFLGKMRLWQRMQEIAAVERYLPEQTVVFDESIYHATLAVAAPSAQPMSAACLRSFYESIPTPAAAVHVAAPAELICQRLLKREACRRQRVLSLQHLDQLKVPERVERQLAAIDVAIGVLDRRGIPVLSIDAGGRLEDQLPSIEAFLRTTAASANAQPARPGSTIIDSPPIARAPLAAGPSTP